MLILLVQSTLSNWKGVALIDPKQQFNFEKVPKIAIFARRTRLWGAIANHLAGLPEGNFFSRHSYTYILIWFEENVFCFSFYGIQFLATF